MSKKIKKKVVPKFALGTTIEDPSDALYQNQMDWADAQFKGANNGWVQGTKIGGNLLQMVGQGMMQKGLASKQGADGKGVAGFLNKNSGSVNSGLNIANAIGNFFAMGGTVDDLFGGPGDTIPATKPKLNPAALKKQALLEELAEEKRLRDAKAAFRKKVGERYKLTPEEITTRDSLNVANKDFQLKKRARILNRTPEDLAKEDAEFAEYWSRMNPTEKGDGRLEGLKSWSEYNEAENGKGDRANGSYRSKCKGENIMASQRKAFGGPVENVPVEVEGGETGQMPNGQMLDFNGPSHEEGGIPTSLPVGTEMYSNRIKVDGVSISDKVRKGARKEMRLEDLLSKAKGDALLTNALNRTKAVNEIEKANFQKIQDTVKQALEGPSEVHAWGNTVGNPPVKPLFANMDMSIFDEEDPEEAAYYNDMYGKGTSQDSTPTVPTTPTIPNQSKSLLDDVNIDGYTKSSSEEDMPHDIFDILGTTAPQYNMLSQENLNDAKKRTSSSKSKTPGIGGITLGDAIGMAGNIYSTFAPMNNTLKNRAGDKPNINAYKDYGKDGLKTIDQAGQYLDMIKAQKQKDLLLSRNSTMKSIDNSTRSLNVNRAMKLAADASVNNTNENIANNFAEQMFGVANTKAGMQNQRDQIVMAGNQAKDLADREDRDNFFSQMATDIATKGQGIQEMSYDLNKMKEGKEMTKLVNQLSKYGYRYNPKTGELYMDESFKSKN